MYDKHCVFFKTSETKMYQLETDAGFSSAHQPIEISKEKITKNSIAIREIQFDDLFYLEEDLTFPEKVKIILKHFH